MHIRISLHAAFFSDHAGIWLDFSEDDSMLSQHHVPFRPTPTAVCIAWMLLPAVCCGYSQLSASETALSTGHSDAADFAVMTDLWRSEFGSPVGRSEAEHDEDPGDVVHPGGAASVPAGVLDVAEGFASALPLTSADELPPDGETSGDLAMMSDWEMSESRATVSRGESYTKDGPSVVTAIVAIVGFIVIGGAYLSGRAHS